MNTQTSIQTQVQSARKANRELIQYIALQKQFFRVCPEPAREVHRLQLGGRLQDIILDLKRQRACHMEWARAYKSSAT